MTTTTKTTALIFHIVFNGVWIATETRAMPKTLRGLARMITGLHPNQYGSWNGWGLRLAPEGREAALAWVAKRLGGHDGDAQRWFAERAVGGID